ncbi:YndM family protein [Gracilibacillus lacisalsi]|uniref:YndM family protein n=1 Tax=Gracilibacillus lacisalsi TaxID=393087 RepID=UPI000369C9DE|nr:YndM family protein [Gracilibacillus lacisalsi]
MKHVSALLIKFIASLVLLYLILGLMYGMTFGEVFLLTAVLGLAAYVIGDLLILPRTNNTLATVADFFIAWLIIFMFVDGMAVTDNIFTATTIAALAVGVFEIFFHRYLANQILPDDEKGAMDRQLQYQTEISDELGEQPPKDEKFDK